MKIDPWVAVPIECTVKGAWCGGALLACDELRDVPDGSLACWRALIISGNARGVSCRVLANKSTGAVALEPWWSSDGLGVPLSVQPGDIVILEGL